MAPSRRKGGSKAAAAAAARRQWKVGDLVLAKLKGFPAWPATVSEPEKWGFSADWKKVLVYFFGTQQIAFCNPVDVEAFTEEKKQNLLVKRQGKGADFVRAVQEIVDIYEKSKKQEQVDDLNSGTEATAANCGKSVESAPNLQLKEISEEPAETSDPQSKSSNLQVKSDCREHDFPGKEAIVSVQAENLHVKLDEEEPVLEERPKDRSVLCTYSLRKKSGGSQVNGSITRRKVPSARKSRTSSRAETCSLENSTASCKDSEKVSTIISSNSAQNGSSRKSRWNGKILDQPRGVDKDSSTFVQNGSIEDNGSEIMSVESESTSFNDGSAADSCFKEEQCENVIDCAEGEVELRKGLDLPLHAVLKKKRNPNRKRVVRDAAEPTSNEDNGTATDTVMSAGKNSESTFTRTTESCPKDEGDEHLPLLKRARVRMGKLLSKEDLNTSFTSSEEKVQEVMENSLDLNHHSFCDEKVLKKVEGNASEHNNNSASRVEEEISKKCSEHTSLNCSSLNHDDPANPCVNRITADGVSVSEECSEESDQRPLWKQKSHQSYVYSADGEAALPPSKRLHRALEAMSANAAQECPSSYGASMDLQPATSSFSSHTSPHVAIVCEASNDSRQHIPDSIFSHVPRVQVSSSPTDINQKSPKESNTVEDMDICPHSTERSASPMQVENIPIVIDEDVKNAEISVDPIDDPIKETQSTRPLSPKAEANEPVSSLNQALQDPSCTKDEADAVIPEFRNSSSGEQSAEKLPNPIQSTGGSPSSVGNIEKVTAVSSGCAIESLQKGLEYDSENDGNENVRLQWKDSRQDDTMCLDNGTVQDQVLSGGNHVSGSNHDLDSSAFPSSPDNGVHSSPRVSQLDASICHNFNSEEDRSKISKQDGSCSPVEASHFSSAAHDAASSESSDRKLESSVTPPAALGKNGNCSETHAALCSFEAVLGTLTRTKDSISRATRIALDCAKFGFTSKAFEVLACRLENESSLYRRVDMFFLVDSIMQWSRGLKGDPGGGYPSLIQGALPRLLSAAAPAGSSAHENRRQCLKVLKLWLEKRFLPDSILRNHIRELDMFSAPASVNLYGRRSSRNERSFDDPVREMEGMLVDEYGSNSSFQLPGFFMPRMLKDDDEGNGSDSDGSFEAVTPEHMSRESPQHEATSTMGKHRHILQDVDGELEMEDVAPEVQIVSLENSQSSKQQFPPPPPPPPHAAPSRSVLPPTPQSISGLPPQPPPPPPPTAPSIHPPHPIASTVSECRVNGLHQNSHAIAQSGQGNLGQPPPHPPVPPRDDQMIPSRSHYHNFEGRESQQHHMPMPEPSSSTYNNRRSMENGDRDERSRFNNSRGYHMRPPYTLPPSHFSHGHPDQRGRPRRDGPPPYSGRFHHQHNRGNGHYHNNNHERMKPPPYEGQEDWRFSDPYSGPRYPEKGKSSCAPGPYGGPPCEPERFPNHGWSSYPPRPMGHRNHQPYRPHYEGPGYWGPR